MITIFICIVIFVWLAVCAAKMIAKRILCKDCILKRNVRNIASCTVQHFVMTTILTITSTIIHKIHLWHETFNKEIHKRGSEVHPRQQHT